MPSHVHTCLKCDAMQPLFLLYHFDVGHLLFTKF
jgi:hypothetical protein